MLGAIFACRISATQFRSNSGIVCAERAAPLKELAPQKREVARAPGYLRPEDFLAMFRFVREKAYETKSFRDYVRALPS